jgi:hypothetical protein
VKKVRPRKISEVHSRGHDKFDNAGGWGDENMKTNFRNHVNSPSSKSRGGAVLLILTARRTTLLDL